MPLSRMSSDSVTSPWLVRLDGLVEVVRGHPGGVVIALQELVPVRDALALAREHHAVDEGHGLAAVGEQAGLGIAGLALAWIGVAAVVRVARQHHARVGVVLHQHVGSGAHRPPVEREVALGHAGLGEEAVHLARHRAEEGHRQPVQELRIGALQGDAVGVAIHHFDAGQREALEIQPAGRAIRRHGRALRPPRPAPPAAP